MKKYKCISSFTDDNGKSYSYGDKIDMYEYEKLTSSQQRKFNKIDDDDTPSYMRPGNIAMGDMFGSGLPGGFDLDITTPW